MDLLFISAVLIRPITFITITSDNVVVVSTDFLDMPIVAIETIPVAIVAIPVSVCYAIVDEGAVFIFAELAHKLRLQR